MPLQIIANSVVSGCSIALVAISVGLALLVPGFFDFALGVMIVVGAYSVYAFTGNGLSTTPAVVIGVVFAGSLGGFLNLIVQRPLRESRASASTMLLTSIGLLVCAQNIIALIFGDDVKSLRTGGARSGISILGLRVTGIQIITVVVCLILAIALSVFLKRTSAGRRIRAVATDRDLANVLGLEPERLILLTNVIGAGLAGVAGILIGYDSDISPSLGFDALLLGIVAAIAGGVGSVPGAVLGGLLIGLAKNLGTWLLPSQWQNAIVFVVLLLFLLLRPQGIFGKPLRSAKV